MTTKKPVMKESFERQLGRIRSHCKSESPMMKIAPIARMEMIIALSYYHGGRGRLALALLREWFVLARSHYCCAITMFVCDRMGWTKVYHYPETDSMIAHSQRHGRKCSGSPNCSNANCIDDSVPRWFKILSRWDK